MKKLVYSLFVLFSLGMVSCQSGNDVNPATDYTGVYSFTATGLVTLSYGSNSIDYPLNESGSFTLSMVDDNGRVMLTGYNDTIYGTIAGNKLFFESSTVTEEYNGFTLQLTFIYGTGTFQGNQLSWGTDVQAYASGSLYGIPLVATGSGTVDMIATKNAE